MCRDADGRVVFAACRRVKAYWSPEVAEAKAIQMGVRLGLRFGIKERSLNRIAKW